MTNEPIPPAATDQADTPQRTFLAIVHVIAVETGGKLDCCDTDTAHAWVTATHWLPRRAYLTGAAPFAAVAGCEPTGLVDRFFTAQLPADPPGDTDTNGERLEWPELEECPPLPDDWMGGSR
ncbi:hypothetical protein GCM10020367_20600 [Streptomyces sannanensis]|uniref:Uncharacterized protein n=1 Tax=Streptomyces sannanensis TaxID=285536 RepID=A0ABP6S912_9ACTN